MTRRTSWPGTAEVFPRRIRKTDSLTPYQERDVDTHLKTFYANSTPTSRSVRSNRRETLMVTAELGWKGSFSRPASSMSFFFFFITLRHREFCACTHNLSIVEAAGACRRRGFRDALPISSCQSLYPHLVLGTAKHTSQTNTNPSPPERETISSELGNGGPRCENYRIQDQARLTLESTVRASNYFKMCRLLYWPSFIMKPDRSSAHNH